MINMKHVALILTMASLVACYCPYEMVKSTGNCSFRIHCFGSIERIRLPNQCMEASNDPVTVDLTLTEAIDHLDARIDKELLSFITTLRISGYWPKTKLAILNYTTRLENLFLNNNQIEKINGEPFYTLSSLDVLDLSHNKLTQINNLFRFELQPNKLRKLNLAHNKIQNITVNAFSELTSLSELDLSYNAISDLTVEPFANLTSLEVLRLNNNKILDLNGAVNNLQYLNHLYLRGNQIEHIDDESLKIILHLETFDVSSNRLDKINSFMLLRHWTHFGNHAVCKILLSGNHLTSLPNTTSITRFTRDTNRGRISTDVVTELDLSNNEITTIEYNAFQSIIRLTSLNLSNNKIVDFVVNANDVVHVRILNLSNNLIIFLNSGSFSHMKSLQDLDLSFNNLEKIPYKTFHKIYNLQKMNLTNNSIVKIDNLNIDNFHLNGGVLDLSNNELTYLTIKHGDGLHLTTLILHSNNISDVSMVDLWHQADLKTLDMSLNKIRKMHEKSLRLPVKLSSLDLSWNQIESIAPSTFQSIWHLKTLHLAHNQLKAIEYGTFRGLSSLENLDLSHNKMVVLDSNLMMDLKSLSTLCMGYNGLNVIYDEGWFGHKYDLKLFLDGNNFTCEWLAYALKNHNNGYTKMRPRVLKTAVSGNTLEGIPCTPEGSQMGYLHDKSSMVMADERLLLTSQKILEAIKEQTYFLRNYVWRQVQGRRRKN